MKILQLCLRVPFPLLDGGNIAMVQAATALLKAGHEVHLLTLNTQKHRVSANEEQMYMQQYFGGFPNRASLQSVPIDTTVKPIPALLHLLSRRSYNIARFYSVAMAAALKETLLNQTFDIVQLESLFMIPYLPVIRKYSEAKVVLRAHNVEHIIWQRLAMTEPVLLKKLYLRQLVRSLKRYEVAALNQLDGILAITPDDADIFRSLGYTGPMIIIPVSVDAVGPPPENTGEPVRLFHLGSMEWMPNQEGIRWFLEKCWPLIHAAHPQLQLFLAGRGFPPDLAAAAGPQVTCEGLIEDATAYMKDKAVMVVPLLSGSGMRVKIIQGMAAGKVIISTKIGAEGIACTHGETIFLANTPEAFLEAVNVCLENRQLMNDMAVAAQSLVKRMYSAEAVGKKLVDFYSGLREPKLTVA